MARELYAQETEVRLVAADRGTNVTLACGTPQTNTEAIQWVHRGYRTHHEILVCP